MSYVQLIYNPMAGQRTFKSRLDSMIEVFQQAGYELRIHRTTSNEDFSTFFENKTMEDCAAIMVAGGDGSFNLAVNAIYKNGIDVPVGVIPAGTANDFAKHLGMPDNFQECFNVLSNVNHRGLDLGIVNGEYFVNVCSGGLLINISHDIQPELKSAFGKMAYYIKGVRALPNFRSLRFRISANDEVYEEDLFLFLVLNGSSAGGFNRIGEYASMKDGKLDFVGIRSCNVNDVPVVFTKILLGDHLEDKNILYFQSDHIVIESLETEEIPSDIDGEKGPEFPLDIRVLPEQLKVLVN